MRAFRTHAATALLGVSIGTLATSHVWILASSALREASASEYLIEQEFLTARAERERRPFRAALHRLNVADAQAELGFRWLERSRNATYWEWFRFPWTHQGAVREFRSSRDDPSLEPARRSVEAIYRGAAATALERLGEPELARREWEHAFELAPHWTEERHRAFQRHDRESPLNQETEAAYLDSRSHRELDSALEKIRMELGLYE